MFPSYNSNGSIIGVWLVNFLSLNLFLSVEGGLKLRRELKLSTL